MLTPSARAFFLRIVLLMFNGQNGPWPMQLVVPSAVIAAVKMLTIT